jgi:hypothetical protein
MREITGIHFAIEAQRHGEKPFEKEISVSLCLCGKHIKGNLTIRLVYVTKGAMQ